MSSNYHVVYEYDITLGGLYGYRTSGFYLSKEDFEKDIHRHQFVVAKGITQQEATDLCALTPEICRYMAAIQDYFDNNPNPNAIKLYEKLRTIREFAIMADRKTIFAKDWERINAKPYIKFFRKLAERNPTCLKSFAIMWALSTIIDEDTGEVI